MVNRNTINLLLIGMIWGWTMVSLQGAVPVSCLGDHPQNPLNIIIADNSTDDYERLIGLLDHYKEGRVTEGKSTYMVIYRAVSQEDIFKLAKRRHMHGILITGKMGLKESEAIITAQLQTLAYSGYISICSEREIPKSKMVDIGEQLQITTPVTLSVIREFIKATKAYSLAGEIAEGR